MFNKKSYELHTAWYNRQFPGNDAKRDYLNQHSQSGNDIGSWLQQLFFSCLDPLLKEKDQHWLTVGDAYGFDAQYILGKGNRAVATDLNTDFLSLACEEGIVTDFSAQNAEQLGYLDGAFDYLLCKESYHHFPRPYAALYEMIRVANKGIVLIEPQDPISKMPGLLWVVNVLSALGRSLISKVWKNRFSYEPVGNFVYKVSEREMEKFAAGLGLPLLAFKKINPNFYFKGAETVKAELRNPEFLKIRFRKGLRDLLVKLRLIPSQVLSAVIFKELPGDQLRKDLVAAGYELLYIPPNPYLREQT